MTWTLSLSILTILQVQIGPYMTKLKPKQNHLKLPSLVRNIQMLQGNQKPTFDENWSMHDVHSAAIRNWRIVFVA